MNRATLWSAGGSWSFRANARRLASALESWTPALLFGLRLWASVCLALYVAFSLELNNAYWAGTSAAIVCQPTLGASLRKGWFRMVGTVIGAVAIVALTAVFPQQRTGFLLGLALWCAACALVATLLRNFAAYAASLAGFTAAIVASDELGAVGGPNGDAFMLAVARASEICIGIVCAGVVLAATDFGGARRRLGAQLAGISAEIAGRFASTFSLAGPHEPLRGIRRDLVRRVIALDPVIDDALGEATDLRPHAPILQGAVGGLFAALAGWRTVDLRLELLPTNTGRAEAELIQRSLPPEVCSAPVRGEAESWALDPLPVRKACDTAVRALTVLPVRTPSLRLLADRSAQVLFGIRNALDALRLLADPAQTVHARRIVRLQVPDRLPSLVNATRALVTVGGVELFWIATAWPSGAQAIAFAAVAVVLFSPRADQAYDLTMSFMVGIGLTAAFAAIVKFAVLPGLETFVGFSLALGLVLVPAGAFITQAWQPLMFMAMTVNFVPLLAPANRMSYDTGQFYNAASAIVIGVAAGALAFRLLPPLSPALRSRRLLALTLRDLRRLTTGPIPRTTDDWEDRIYARLSVLPEQAEPLQRGQLLAALFAGRDIIRLRHIAHRFGLDVELHAALEAVARGHSAIAIEHLGQLDRMLTAMPDTRPGARVRLRARGNILAMSEALAQHAAYFDSGAAP
jgi:uncharacterized membrane protein YccC